MDPVAVTPNTRGIKRRRNDVQSPISFSGAKRQGVATRGKLLLVGKYVKKELDGRVFLGKVVLYEDGLYRVDYENGDSEDLDGAKVKNYLVEDGNLDKKLMARKCKLDELIFKKNKKHAEGFANNAKGLALETKVDVDQCSDSSNHDMDMDEDLNTKVKVPAVPPPQFPPSSGNIGVAEEYVAYLLSVYGFLRSFSVQLYLSPFVLDDFVGSLNCPLPNTLLDAIHVALMRVLKRHLEMLASDGSELALNCMRLTDWSLLDTLTWPSFLVQYLMIMRRISGQQWKGFYLDAVEKSYYSLPTGWKLMILQFLCDDVLDSMELRSEIDKREEAEVGIDSDDVLATASETVPNGVHPRYSETSVGILTGTRGTKGIKGCDTSEDVDMVDDGNGYECRLCGMDGTLLCCDGCPSVFHSRCIGVSKMFIPEGVWYCPECVISRAGLTIARGTSLTGAEVFGVDSYGHVFMGTCNHLLVLEVSLNSESCFRYYNQKDIPKVLQVLLSSSHHIMLYSDICKAILRYWDIQKDVIVPFRAKIEMDEQSAEVKDNSGEQPTPMDTKLEGCITENSGVEIIVSRSENSDKVAQIASAGNKKSNDVCVYMGLHFKPQAYVNNYSQGDFASSAAVSLAVLTSEEREVSESHALDKRRKMALADNLLQMKAFSSAAVRFFWPTTERKLVEVPRERCGWCLSCKAPPSSKKGCLLNAAASNAIKGAMKILSGLPVIKNGEGSICAIATYIIYMEESLSGLIVGAFRSSAYRKQWRKRVELATTCGTLNFLLLELEGNIRAVVLSPDWFKLVESWLINSSVTQSASITTGSTQKRSLRGKQGRKPSDVSESASDDQTDSSISFTWWRGGVLSKRIQQRGVLPLKVVKKTARQGGCRKIPGIVYTEDSKIPKRSRQYFWRAAVEMSKNASELAIQVRRLDNYIKWSDLVRPEQTLQDGKNQDAAALAFRNAYVCNKKNLENKIIYGVSFRGQKHLPSRIMKNIIEVEQSKDGSEKYWLSEKHIPLYLIKEYEEKVNKLHFPLLEKPANVLSNLQKRQLKVCRKDIFSYMSLKRDNLVKFGCASCQLDVLLRNAVKCSVCEGFCHELCTIGSTTQRDDKAENLITCKLCHTKNLPKKENESPNSRLLFQGQNIRNIVTGGEGFKQTSYYKPVTPVTYKPLIPVTYKPLSPVTHLNLKMPLEMKSGGRESSSVSKDRPKIASWGLIFKKYKPGKSLEEKEKEDEDGLKFRMSHILRKGTSNRISEGPICHLCDQPYNPGLMYIHCDTCKNWFHSEALELDESRISDLVGFKCCRCRRIKTPVCPYMDPNKKKARTKHVPKEIVRTPVFSSRIKVVPGMSGDDSLSKSLSMIEQFSEPSSEIDTQWNSVTSAPRTGPRKLTIKRDVNNDKNIATDQVQDMDISGNGILFDSDEFNLEDMEFEPQTYFSYNDLLAPDAKTGTTDSEGVYIQDIANNFGDLQNEFPKNNIPPEICSNAILCQGCSLADPRPDLCCQVCELYMHSHCSPWVEGYPSGDQWRCGKCREWC